jgi:hypothetical protein
VPTSDEPALTDSAGNRLISVADAARLSGFTPRYISRLLRTGKLAGSKIGRDWFTTEQAIRAYLAQDRRPGPKTD